MVTFDTAKARGHAERVLFHLSKSEGLREAGEDPAGDMAEAKRHLTEIANEFGLFLDPIDRDALVVVEGHPSTEGEQPCL
jgi:hypothetical protein